MKMIINTIFLVCLIAAYLPLYLTKTLPSGSTRDIDVTGTEAYRVGTTGVGMLHNKENIAQGIKNGGRPSGENRNNRGSGSAVIPVYAAGANNHKNNHHNGACISNRYGMGLSTLIATTLASVIVHLCVAFE